jgi:hypothetical protein
MVKGELGEWAGDGDVCGECDFVSSASEGNSAGGFCDSIQESESVAGFQAMGVRSMS